MKYSTCTRYSTAHQKHQCYPPSSKCIKIVNGLLMDELNDLNDLKTSERERTVNKKRIDRSKSSIARHQPLKHKINTSVNLKDESRRNKRRSCSVWRESLTATNEERLKQVEEQIESTLRLPTTSSYAQHRLRILNKAKQMLTAQSTLNEGEQLELEQLLAQLSIRYKSPSENNSAKGS